MYIVLGCYRDGSIIRDVTLKSFDNMDDAIVYGRKFKDDYLFIKIRHMDYIDNKMTKILEWTII